MEKTAAVRIALVVGTDGEYSRGVLRGVRRFVRTSGRRWLFAVTPHRAPDFESLAAWKPAGTIGCFIDEASARKAAGLGKPTVGVGFQYPQWVATHVGNDDRALGRAAAEHLLEQRFRRFAFVGWPGLRFSELREEGFSVRLSGEGFSCMAYRGRGEAKPGLFRSAEHARLCAFLRELPAPCGIMACNDLRAWQVLEACREIGRAVPEELAVVGADDDEAWRLLSDPPLSSVQVDADRIGFLAALRLATLLDGGTPPATEPVPPRGVAVRASSDFVATADRDVASAVRFIRENLDRAVSVDEIAIAVGASRRSLERGFRRELARSPADELRRARLRLACELLDDGELPLAEVSRRCGLSEPKQLSILFRRLLKTTPSAYRAARRAQSGSPKDFRRRD